MEDNFCDSKWKRAKVRFRKKKTEKTNEKEECAWCDVLKSVINWHINAYRKLAKVD